MVDRIRYVCHPGVSFADNGMVALCLAVFCVIFVKRVLRKRTFVQLAEATGIVLLWNCWFYVPMLYMMNKDTYKLQQIIGKICPTEWNWPPLW